jgi:hypothetical protein
VTAAGPGTATVQRLTGATSMLVKWTAATAVAAAPRVAGYKCVYLHHITALTALTV